VGLKARPADKSDIAGLCEVSKGVDIQTRNRLERLVLGRAAKHLQNGRSSRFESLPDGGMLGGPGRFSVPVRLVIDGDQITVFDEDGQIIEEVDRCY
jgi:hypothetical protein